ncbi:MAG: aminotransferase class III-fold pyridoxal phosphate-dependent enzyme [Isosphaeraceae bacterium]
MLREQEPNLLRLYLNPHVAQTCFVLDRLARSAWPAAFEANKAEPCQSFLGNSLDEAIGGAIKLLRYQMGAAGNPPSTALILDPGGRLNGFAEVALNDGERVAFLPSLLVFGRDAMSMRCVLEAPADLGLLVLAPSAEDDFETHGDALRALVARCRPRIITCVDRVTIARLRWSTAGLLKELAPDVVVFDDSFTDRAVPFGAFTARTSLFAAWNRPGKSTFHSTTFQPNTISTRHFMNQFVETEPDLARQCEPDLKAIDDDLAVRSRVFQTYYSPALQRLIRTAGFATARIRAEGSYVVVNDRPILDVVGGVACSVRGHNPESYADEVRATLALDEEAIEAELVDRLQRLTGLGAMLPAVSGATAVENALKLALVCQFPRRHVVAFKAGFGGKTLFSLTGTANPSYKQNIGPLFAEVHYVDPFAPDAVAQVDAILERHEVAAVLIELIQSVGGVRRAPASLVQHLDVRRKTHGYLLLVDEIQTGMYRTGTFSQSETFGLTPDVMLLGKGTSDMMFPFALTLHSDVLARTLKDRCPTLRESVRERYGYRVGYATVLNVLRRAEEVEVASQVAQAGGRVALRLASALGPLRLVKDVRVFGLLIAVELDASRGPRSWLRKRLAAFYLLAMLRHERFPVLAGFCQYEPNTLKITPPLDAREHELDRMCDTMAEVLSRPLLGVLLGGLGSLLRSTLNIRERHEHRNHTTLELATR